MAQADPGVNDAERTKNGRWAWFWTSPGGATFDSPAIYHQGSRTGRGPGVGKATRADVAPASRLVLEDDCFVLPVLVGNADHSGAYRELRFVR